MENTTNSTPNLTINDLVALRAIIDVASTRGAFRAPELRDVGEAFNRLNAFVEATLAQNQQAAAADGAEPAKGE
jgi:hypothetical protein